MGIIYNNALVLMKAKQNGTTFDKVLTIGRQNLFIKPIKIKQLAKKFSIDITNFKYDHGDYSEEFIKLFLGAKIVDSLDFNDYENANIIHDLNFAIPKEYHQNYDVVIDGGTLEHIFNFPAAVANCMNFVKQDGSLFIFNMANNHMGHGFYQFSPELFFRIFDSNGFIPKDVILDIHKYPGAELGSSGKCYTVNDPKKVGGRVSLVTKKPVMIMVHGIREKVVDIMSSYPIQSDYQVGSGSTYLAVKGGGYKRSFIKEVAKKMVDMFPNTIKDNLYGLYQLRNSKISNSSFYSKWK